MQTTQGKKLYKVCLTGGPCAGKTTALTRLMQKFSSDFIVYCVPEVATMTFSSGVTIIPSEFTPETHKTFTQGICQMQIDIEKYYETIASIQKKPVLMIVDRGVADNFAYCTPEVKQKIYESTGWNTNYLINERYDLVLHLVTAAHGAEKFYGAGKDGGNEARSETKEVAIMMDGLGRKQWMGHPNFHVIDNSKPGFEAKIDRVIKAVANLTGTPNQTFKKKLLLKRGYSLEELEKHGKVMHFKDTITYLVNNDKNRLDWIVKREFKGNNFPTYFRIDRTLEEKSANRRETHRILNERSYFELRNAIDKETDSLVKDTFSFYIEKNKEFCQFIIEDTEVKGKKRSIMRVLKDEHEGDVFIPDFLEVEKDITEDKEYFTRTLALK